MDVIMAVHDKFPAVSIAGMNGRFGNDNRMASGGTKPRFQANVPAMVDEPVAAGVQILVVLGLS